MRPTRIRVCCFGLLFILMSCVKVPQGANLENPSKGAGTNTGPKPTQGWDVGSGGNAYAAEFVGIGRTVVRRLKSKGVHEVGGISAAAFEKTLGKIEVKTTEAVLMKGDAPVDALNYAQQMKIELSLAHWANLMDFSQKRRLVIHEILGLMRKDDSDYGLTIQVLKALGFLHDVLVDQFRIQGDVAKTIIEKMHWNPDEIEVEEYLPHGRRTWYVIPLSKTVFPLKCLKMELLASKGDTSYSCDIAGTAYYTDEGTIHMELGTHEPLVRLFGRTSEEFEPGPSDWWGVKVTHFDYGLIKGYISDLAHLEIFP